jgi:hypothetical protein
MYYVRIGVLLDLNRISEAILLNPQLSKKLKPIGTDKFNHLTNTLTILSCVSPTREIFN